MNEPGSEMKKNIMRKLSIWAGSTMCQPIACFLSFSALYQRLFRLKTQILTVTRYTLKLNYYPLCCI